jgi:hypothetical protein
MKRIISQVKRSMPFSKLVCTRCPAMVSASWPKKDLLPVWTMTPVVGKVQRVFGGPGGGGRELLDRHRLAGESRLVDEEVLRGEQAQVRGDHVPGRDGDEIARNDLFHRYLGKAFDLRDVGRSAAPLHARGGLDEGTQLGSRLVGAMFLDEGRHDRENHHRGDDHGGAGVAEKVGHHREREQQDIERVLGAIDDLVEDAGAAFLRDLVRPEAPQPFGCLRLVESGIAAIEMRIAPAGSHRLAAASSADTATSRRGCDVRAESAPGGAPSLINSLELILPLYKCAARAVARAVLPLYTATECRLWFWGK